jgi:hypothetical protein
VIDRVEIELGAIINAKEIANSLSEGESGARWLAAALDSKNEVSTFHLDGVCADYRHLYLQVVLLSSSLVAFHGIHSVVG